MTLIAVPVSVVSYRALNKQENGTGHQEDEVTLYSYAREASHIGAGCRL